MCLSATRTGVLVRVGRFGEEDTELKFAYADPPYLGCCARYNHHHPDGKCWDNLATHRDLVTTLWLNYDGWALSASSSSLKSILSICPDDVRIAAWVKPFCAFKKGVRPCYAWEPVIFYGGRNPSNGHAHPPPIKGGAQTTPKDFIAESITLRKGLTGAKPEKVCRWILDLLNVQYGDEVIDIFPGTGIMGRVAALVTEYPHRDESEDGEPPLIWVEQG